MTALAMSGVNKAHHFSAIAKYELYNQTYETL